MATPIKETPILYGKDSDRFLKEVKENENKRISKQEYNNNLELLDNVLSKATFKR